MENIQEYQNLVAQRLQQMNDSKIENDQIGDLLIGSSIPFLEKNIQDPRLLEGAKYGVQKLGDLLSGKDLDFSDLPDSFGLNADDLKKMVMDRLPKLDDIKGFFTKRLPGFQSGEVPNISDISNMSLEDLSMPSFGSGSRSNNIAMSLFSQRNEGGAPELGSSGDYLLEGDPEDLENFGFPVRNIVNSSNKTITSASDLLSNSTSDDLLSIAHKGVAQTAENIIGDTDVEGLTSSISGAVGKVASTVSDVGDTLAGLTDASLAGDENPFGLVITGILGLASLFTGVGKATENVMPKTQPSQQFGVEQ